jgi:hypothetical protein
MSRNLFWLVPGLLLGLLVFMPLSWLGPHIVPDNFKTQETRYSGTIWKGSVLSLRDVETVDFRLKPFSIFGGGHPLEVSVTAPGLQASALAASGKARDVTLQMNIASLPLPDPRLKGLSGQMTARVDKAKWAKDGQCEVFEGTVRSDALTRNRALFQWEGPVLSGPLSCAGDGQFLFDLSGQDELQNITAKILVSATGQYKSDIHVTTNDQDAAQVLPLFGFEALGVQNGANVFRLREQGNWR